MDDPQNETRGIANILPLFAPAFYDFWQVILPRNRLVVYYPEKED
jgi:hypothetical protein